MFKPFNPLELQDIHFLRTLKRRFIVLQAHEIEIVPVELASKSVLLLTDYDALAKARAHKNGITEEKQAVIFDLENDGHREKLEEMIRPDSKYMIVMISSESTQNSSRLGQVTRL